MAGLLDDNGFGGLLGNPLFNMGLATLAASAKPGATFGGAVGQGGLLGMQNLQQAQTAAARNKYLGLETEKLGAENDMAKRRMALLDNISKAGQPSIGALGQPGASPSGQDPFLSMLDRKYQIAQMYEAIDPKASAELFKEAAAQDPRLKLQNTMAGNMLVQGPSGWQYAPGVVPAQAGKEASIEAAKNPALIARAGGSAAATAAAELPYAGPLAQARAAGTAAGELPYAGQIAQARAAGTAAGELPYVGPKAAATSAAQLPYQQQLSAFNTDQDIRKSFASPREVNPGGSLVVPGQAAEIYRSPNPAPGTQQGKFQGGIGDLQSKTVESWHSDAIAAAAQNSTIGQMRDQLNAGLQTGPAFDARTYISNVLTSLGADPTKIAGLPDSKQATLFNKGVKDMLIDRAKAFGANPSNAEDRRIEAALANANDPTEATKAFLDWAEKKNNTKIQKFDEGMAHTFDESGNVKGDPLRFDLDWAKKYGQTAKGTSDTAAQRDARQPKPLDVTTKRDAQNAIMKGANKDAVIARLRQNGFDVSGF